jgi:propanol-preferring alcohol dehydrogenase
MRAMRLVAEGQPLKEMSVEVPPIASRSVLVKVGAAGVCHTDIHLITGAYDLGEGRKISTTGGGAVLPLTPGHEVAGRIDRLGADAQVSGFKEGDPVVVYPWIGCGKCRKCVAGKENLCEGAQRFLGFMQDGGYAEYVAVPDVRYLVRTEGIDRAQSATLACAGLTAFSSIQKCRLRSDDLLFVIGAGGVGSTAVQIAKKVTGARVAVADVDDAKLELAAQLGADHTFNSTRIDAKSLVSQLKGVNQGRGADAVIDFVGTPGTASLGLRLLGHEGRLVLVGLVGGGMQLPLPLLPILGAEVLGNFTGTLPQLLELVDLAKKGKIAPHVSKSYRLEEANEVLARLGRGEIKGRVVLEP